MEGTIRRYIDLFGWGVIAAIVLWIGYHQF